MSYINIAREKFKNLKNKKEILILAIESSCDETAACILKDKKILSNIVSSQIEIHKKFGGVVPEIASRNHVSAIQNIVNKSLEEADVSIYDIDCIAVTYGAGLLGSLLVGLSFAKAFAFALNIPLIAVNHIRGHIAVNSLLNENIEYPYLNLIISGGHTALALAENVNNFKLIGETQDDACGECFDKVARILGLEYPGGPNLEKLAKKGEYIYKYTIPMQDKDICDFSFSGLKTAVINQVHNFDQKNIEYKKEDIARSFQETVSKLIVNNIEKAIKNIDIEIKSIVMSGGVASNMFLREKIEKKYKNKYNIIYPPIKYCTDNAVMIAAEALFLIRNSLCQPQDLSLDAKSNLEIGEII